MNKKIMNKNMKYFIVSYGGVGTYMLMDLIDKNKYLNIPKTSELWQEYAHHIKIPPKTFNQNVRVIYVYGDPYNSLISHFNRRKLKINWAQHHCKNMHGLWEKLDSNWDLADYLKNGEDLFQFEEHFNNWTNIKDKDYDVMILKYEYIKKYEDIILKYLNSRNPISYIPRNSNWKNMDEDIKQLLKNMYGHFHEKYLKYPPIIIY